MIYEQNIHSNLVVWIDIIKYFKISLGFFCNMKQKITGFFFFSKDDLGDFSYGTYKFGVLRLFLELALFLAVKLGIDNSKSCISFSHH